MPGRGPDGLPGGGATQADVVVAAERGNRHGIVSILRLEPVTAVFESQVKTDNGSRTQLAPQLITPFMGINFGTEKEPVDSPVMVIGYELEDGSQIFRGVDSSLSNPIENPLQVWRALQLIPMLAAVPGMDEHRLYDLLRLAGREIPIEARRYMNDLAYKAAGAAVPEGEEKIDIMKARDVVLDKVPTIDDLARMLAILNDNGVVIDTMEINKAINEGRIDLSGYKEIGDLVRSRIAALGALAAERKKAGQQGQGGAKASTEPHKGFHIGPFGGKK